MSSVRSEDETGGKTARAAFWKRLPLGEALRFGVAGGVNTGVHLVIYFALVELAGADTVLASIPAFGGAVVVSFFLNRAWVFAAQGPGLGQFVRFAGVALSGLGINVGSMYVLIDLLGLHYRLGVLSTVALIAVWSYLANKFWTFGTRARGKTGEPEDSGKPLESGKDPSGNHETDR